MSFSPPDPRLLARSLGLAAIIALGLAPGALAQATASAAPQGFQGDTSWMEGTNANPPSGAVAGPVTLSGMVDTYYSYDFNHPADHTVFPAVAAPRSNEFNLNLAELSLELTGMPHLVGKVVLQGGNEVDPVYGTDPSVNPPTGRGSYSSLASLRSLREAYAGYHVDWLSGFTLTAGIQPANIGIESYEPQENWNYTHNVACDFTPYYLQGVCAQLFPTTTLKTELWLTNGWQTLAKTSEGFGYGYVVEWHPWDRLSLRQNTLAGNIDPADPTRTRFYFDNNLQWKYGEHWLGAKSMAIAAAYDYGVESAGSNGASPATMWGAALMHRIQFDDHWSTTERVSFFDDPQHLVALGLPAGNLAAGDLQVGEGTIGIDFSPMPWFIYRFEYRHDFSNNVPYIAGPLGTTPPAGVNPASWTPPLVFSGDRLTLNTTLRF
jgi:hypothetical protein